MAAPYKTLFIILEILNFSNYSYFAKIMTRKPKIINLTNMTELYPFLESKKRHLLSKGILWSRDLLVKTINIEHRVKLTFRAIALHQNEVSNVSCYLLFTVLNMPLAISVDKFQWLSY